MPTLGTGTPRRGRFHLGPAGPLRPSGPRTHHLGAPAPRPRGVLLRRAHPKPWQRRIRLRQPPRRRATPTGLSLAPDWVVRRSRALIGRSFSPCSLIGWVPKIIPQNPIGRYQATSLPHRDRTAFGPSRSDWRVVLGGRKLGRYPQVPPFSPLSDRLAVHTCPIRLPGGGLSAERARGELSSLPPPMLFRESDSLSLRRLPSPGSIRDAKEQNVLVTLCSWLTRGDDALVPCV